MKAYRDRQAFGAAGRSSTLDNLRRVRDAAGGNPSNTYVVAFVPPPDVSLPPTHKFFSTLTASRRHAKWLLGRNAPPETCDASEFVIEDLEGKPMCRYVLLEKFWVGAGRDRHKYGYLAVGVNLSLAEQMGHALGERPRRILHEWTQKG